MVTGPPRRWLRLLYKVPPEPTANRVSIWRKLKRLGAVLVNDALWVLPPSRRTLEEFQWLAADIRERGGDAMLWEASLCLAGQDDELVRQFLAEVDGIYTEFLALSKRYQQARLRDYFRSPLGERARATLLSAGGRTD